MYNIIYRFKKYKTKNREDLEMAQQLLINR